MDKTEIKVKKWAIMPGGSSTRYVALEYDDKPTLIVPKKVFDAEYDGILYEDYEYVRLKCAVKDTKGGDANDISK